MQTRLRLADQTQKRYAKKMIHTGKNDQYYWMVVKQPHRSIVGSLIGLVLRYHKGYRLCITCFDSGLTKPNDSEISAGWTTCGNVMVSPPLTGTLDIPYDQFDEWYIVTSPTFADDEFEIFIRHPGLTLVPPEETYKTFDTTWEKSGLDYLRPIQERFWSQINKIQPQTYVAMGDEDIVVSKDKEMIAELRGITLMRPPTVNR